MSVDEIVERLRRTQLAQEYRYANNLNPQPELSTPKNAAQAKYVVTELGFDSRLTSGLRPAHPEAACTR